MTEETGCNDDKEEMGRMLTMMMIYDDYTYFHNNDDLWTLCLSTMTFSRA